MNVPWAERRRRWGRRRGKRVSTAAEIDEEHSLEVLVPEDGGVDAGAGGMLDGEVAQGRIPAEKIAALFVNHEFLKRF